MQYIYLYNITIYEYKTKDISQMYFGYLIALNSILELCVYTFYNIAAINTVNI